MARPLAIAVALAVALVSAGGALAGEAGRAEGSFVVDSSAEIVKGNVAQARQEALSNALAAAVEQAAVGLMGPEGRPEAVRAWLPNPQGFVLSYRILSEGRVEPPPEAAPLPRQAAPQAPGLTPAAPAAAPPPPTYALRVEALVSLAALKRELRAHKLLPPEEDVLPPVAVTVEEAGGLKPEQALALLVNALEQAGFRVRAGKPAPEDLEVAARLKLNCTGAGCSGEAVLSVREEGGPGIVASGSGGGQGGEEGAALAFKAAAANLAARLRQPVPVAVCLKGLRHYRELAQIKAALEQMGLVARERSLQRGEVVLEVRVAGGARALSARLADRKWTGFSLGRPEAQAGGVVLSRLPAPAAP